MLNKIDVRDIVSDHFRTLVKYNEVGPSWGDLALFLGVPIAAAAFGVYRCLLLTDGAVTVLITAVAILGGLLFNMLVLIHTIADRFLSPTTVREGREFLKQIYSNVAYAILVALVTLLPLALLSFVKWPGIAIVLGAVALFFCAHLLLTLLMILKRLHALLSLELGQPQR